MSEDDLREVKAAYLRAQTGRAIDDGMDKDTIDAKLEAVEARTDAKFERLIGRIDALGVRIDSRLDHMEKTVTAVQKDLSDQRTLTITTSVALFFGIVAIVVAVQFGIMAVFGVGADTSSVVDAAVQKRFERALDDFAKRRPPTP